MQYIYKDQRYGVVYVGFELLIPIQMGQSSPKKAAETNESSVTSANKAAPSNKPKRTGSLALFFRKVIYILDLHFFVSVSLGLSNVFVYCVYHCGVIAYYSSAILFTFN